MRQNKTSEEKQAEARAAQIVRRIGSGQVCERISAEAQLQQNGLNTIPNLLRLYDAERRKWQNARRTLKMVRNTLFALFVVVYYLRTGQMPHIGLFLTLFFITGIIFTGLYMNTRRAFAEGMAVALSKFDDVSMIGPLIVLYRGNWDTKDVVLPLLTRLLPRLQASDAALLNEWQRERLYMELDHCSSRMIGDSVNIEFIKAILKALEQTGDAKALKHVEKMAHSARNPALRFAAQDCLPFLQARTEQQRSSNTLLRPTTLVTPPSELVRPAAVSPPDEPQQLLRAGKAE